MFSLAVRLQRSLFHQAIEDEGICLLQEIELID
jgi:hypothetical protein